MVFNTEIPFQVSKNELLVRGIGHFIFYSQKEKKLKREAFLPPPDKTDVSLLRRVYTSDDFCKQHAKKIKIGDSYQYCGLATFYFFQIDEINPNPAIAINPYVAGTPIDENGNYIKTPPVFVTTPGLPMHADLVYPLPTIKGSVNTENRQFAQNILKKALYHNDPFPDVNDKWLGNPLLAEI